VAVAIGGVFSSVSSIVRSTTFPFHPAAVGDNPTTTRDLHRRARNCGLPTVNCNPFGFLMVLFGGGTESCLWRDDSDSNLTVNRCQLGEGIDTQRSAADDRSSAGRHRGSGASSQDTPQTPKPQIRRRSHARARIEAKKDQLGCHRRRLRSVAGRNSKRAGQSKELEQPQPQRLQIGYERLRIPRRRHVGHHGVIES